MSKCNLSELPIQMTIPNGHWLQGIRSTAELGVFIGSARDVFISDGWILEVLKAADRAGVPDASVAVRWVQNRLAPALQLTKEMLEQVE